MSERPSIVRSLQVLIRKDGGIDDMDRNEIIQLVIIIKGGFPFVLKGDNMTISDQPDTPKKGLPKMLIAVIIIAVVAIAAVAGAVLLMNNGGSDKDKDGSNTDDQNDNSSGMDNLANGDFMELRTTTESNLMWMNMTMRWEISNLDSSGYDVTIKVNSDFFNYTTTTHASTDDALGAGAVDDNYTKGILIGTEPLSTSMGNKQVEHWRLTNAEGSASTVTDYYVGKDTKMVYKWVVTTTDSSNPEENMVSTTLLTDTNIDAIKNGDKV